MPKSTNQKLKLLYLMKMLLEKTDEDNTITISDMIAELKRYEIKAERKSIYDDLEVLKSFGVDITSRKSKTSEYFVANRLFELPELKLLVDAIQCSKFVTQKKSNELIKKIESLTSANLAKSLHRQVIISNRLKAINESIYYNVDSLHAAIAENKQIAFKYFDYDIGLEKIYRKNGEKYVVSPYGLSWDDENYYLVTYAAKYNDFSHYRVDRMSDVELVDIRREPLADETNFNIVDYSKKVFSMFGGKEELVELQFDISLVNSVIDRFGTDITIKKQNDSHFKISHKIIVSSTFYGWLCQFGPKVKIISPGYIANEYNDFLREIIAQY